ncbi:MAG: glycosyltransferase [Proteobacteria bacterium]|nr:glycosyltransferase [Pseudomonadota bacterium]
MKILHVVPSYLPAVRYGGPIASVHGLCKALVARGHEVEVFTTNVDGPGDSDVPLGIPVELDGVKVWYFPVPMLRRLYWCPKMAAALRRRVDSLDVIHTHSVFLWPTWAAARVARAYSVPYVLAPRGMLVAELLRRKSRWFKSAWIELFERRNLAKAAVVHFTSQLEKDEATKLGLNFNATCVVPNGIEEEEICDESDKRDLPPGFPLQHQRYLLFIGRINWKKGLDRLICALPFVADCHLVIMGNDEEQYQPTLVALARQKGVRERISFIGPIYGSDKRTILAHAAALILPSYSENFGNVVLESMAAGCPVVVTPEVGAAVLVLETGAGVVLDGSPEKLGRGIADLIADSERSRTMGQRGRDAVAANYTWEAIARRMETVYQMALEEHVDADQKARPEAHE